MNQEKFSVFAEAYRKGLLEAVQNEPEEYYYGPEQVPQVVEKMLKAIQENPKGVNYTNSGGFKRACKILGIKYTVKNIFSFLEIS